MLDPTIPGVELFERDIKAAIAIIERAEAGRGEVVEFKREARS